MSDNFSLLSSLVTMVVCATLASTAIAGTFFEKDGAAIKGYDPVGYFAENKPVQGLPAYQAEYKGSTFRFVSQANRDTFKADPARYAPQYGGFCAYGTASGYKAAVDPTAFTVVDGKLYLNYNADVQKRWTKDIPGFISKADQNWPEVVGQTKVIE